MATKNQFQSFKSAFHKQYVKQRNAQLERDLVLAQTKLRYLMEHVGSDIVPLLRKLLSCLKKTNVT